MKRLAPLVLLAALASPAAAPGVAAADVVNDELVCPEPELELDKYRYLRALSLDLRGRIPTYDEYRALDGLPDVPEALIDEWLDSIDFADRAVRRFRDLVWNNIRTSEIMDARGRFEKAGQVWFRPEQAQSYRGGPDDAPCLDEPATTDESGAILTKVKGKYHQEGWVYVTPYWDPATKLKVCAFDAQDAQITSKGTDCSTRNSYGDSECGCGPNLVWCGPPNMNAVIADSFTRDLDKRVAAMVLEDRPYMDLFTERRAWVNGPLVHFWKHLSTLAGPFRFAPLPVDVDALPDLTWLDDDVWVQVEQKEGNAGVLSSVAYMMRFQTNRSRANRFYDAFLCQPFNPPAGGLPASTDAAAQEPDLQKRDGCKYCHALLEPAAAHWGRWTELGGAFLDPEHYPAYREECDQCAGCSAECTAFYITQAKIPQEEPYTGWLRAYLYRSEAHYGNVELGPSLLAATMEADGRLQECTSKTTAEWLLGRALGTDEAPFLDGLVNGFVGSGYSYRGLVKAIVTSPVYRRVQ